MVFNKEKLTILVFSALFMFWALTNISSTVMSFMDGRSVSFALTQKTDTYLNENVSVEIHDEIEQLKNGNIPIFGEWLVSSYYGDSLNYMSMALGDKSFEPYSLRPLYPFVVGKVSELRLNLGETDKFRVYSSTFFVLNVTFFILSVLLAVKLLSTYIKEPVTLIGISILAFMQLGYLKTLYSPMVDQPAVFLSLLICYFAFNRNVIGLTITAVIAVLTKDALIIMGAIPGLYLILNREFRMLLPCIAFLVTFVLLRVLSDSDPLSLQYGWEVSKGEIKLDYLKGHFSSFYSLINWLFGLWFSFGPAIVLSVILLFFSTRLDKRDKLILGLLLTVSILFLLAQVLLASRIARTLTPASIVIVLFSLGIAIKYYKAEIDEVLSRLIYKDN